MFANRLRKRARHLARWAKRDRVTCYRLYDRDIPEIPLAVDWYDGRLHVAEYARGGEPAGDDWIAAMGEAACEALGVPPERLWFKRRERQRGLAQYEKVSAEQARFKVREDGLAFVVNLSDYLDTGLFLDHRATRAMVRAEARGRDFLNLFAYTGAFSVHAAAGGARSTTTVDLSRTYLDWAAENLAENGFEGPRHALVQADVTRWIAEAPAASWDLVVCDPPTFSNSKRMDDVFDVQRDHVRLLHEVLRVTRPGGVVYFSTNFRRFKPEPAAFAGAHAVEISDKTVPEDFRNTRIHRCWRIEKP
ncbi:MAG: methyltransferase domain-containing protein [Deltaproteobacteria bacterium]|nr:MAG: methyltransferase domain-containing protein [Deltaproteobacteria bacterium]